MVELKTEWFGARWSKTKAQAVREYCEIMDRRPTDLVRDAVSEYMINHPAPEPEKPNE